MCHNADQTVLHLDMALPLKGGWPIKVAGRGTSRQAREKEAASLLIGALATVAQNSGVKTMNMTDHTGTPIALIIIEGARFHEEDDGTVFSSVIEVSE